MDALKKMLITTPNQHPSSQSGMFSQKLFFKSSLLPNEAFKFVPPSSSDDLCLLFCIYPSMMYGRGGGVATGSKMSHFLLLPEAVHRPSKIFGSANCAHFWLGPLLPCRVGTWLT